MYTYIHTYTHTYIQVHSQADTLYFAAAVRGGNAHSYRHRGILLRVRRGVPPVLSCEVSA